MESLPFPQSLVKLKNQINFPWIWKICSYRCQVNNIDHYVRCIDALKIPTTKFSILTNKNEGKFFNQQKVSFSKIVWVHSFGVKISRKLWKSSADKVAFICYFVNFWKIQWNSKKTVTISDGFKNPKFLSLREAECCSPFNLICRSKSQKLHLKCEKLRAKVLFQVQKL